VLSVEGEVIIRPRLLGESRSAGLGDFTMARVNYTHDKYETSGQLLSSEPYDIIQPIVANERFAYSAE
jgi:hypothetical protein